MSTRKTLFENTVQKTKGFAGKDSLGGGPRPESLRSRGPRFSSREPDPDSYEN
jgi:hypothetical protein